MRKKFLLMTFLTLLFTAMGTNLLRAENGNVAKVGNTEYATIDDAIAAWTNGTTLTLLADVTLSDVVTINSTEHHILNLSTYTMTAASGKNAFVIKACGTGAGEQYAITINADATNPGGINAGSKCIIYYKYADGGISTEDRPIIKINGGVFTGSTSSWGTAGIYTIGTAARKCATLNISGGTFNCSINGSGKSKLLVSGGVFNYSVGSTGDSTCYRLISGGTFKSFGFMTADSNNTKFWIGTSMANSDVGAYIDDNGYLVVGGPVVTEPGTNFEASSPNHSNAGFGNYLTYSSVATNGIYYTSVEEALTDNNKTDGSVTVYVDELDMADFSSYKGTIVVPEGSRITITNAPADLNVVDKDGNAITPNENGTYTTVTPEGNDFTGYTRTDAIWGEVRGNAYESFVIKVLDANDNVMGTTSLNNIGGIIDGDVNVTWSLKLDAESNTDEYWAMEWTAAPSIDNMPAKVELWVDGVRVSGGNVVLNAPDNLNPIYAAVTDADGKILSYHTSIADAVAAAQDKDVIEIIKEGNYTLPEFAGKELTFKGSSRTGTSITDWVNKGSQGMMGSTVHFENLTISGQTENYYGLFHTNAVTYKNCDINGLRFLYSPTTFENCAFNANGVEHSFWTYGASNVTVTGCKFTYTDRAVNCYSENGANHELHITFSDCDFEYAGPSDEPAGAVEINSSSVKSMEVAFTNDCTAPAKGAMWFNSQWDPKHGANTVVKVDGVVVWTAPAKIGETRYATLQEAVDAAQDGDVVTLIADVTEDEVLITQKADVDVTIDGNGKTFTGHMTIFGSGRHTGAETLTIQNVVFQAVVDEGECIASATNINGVNSYAHNVTIDNCSFNGNDTYSADNTFAIRFPYGGVGYDLTVKNCTADDKMFGLLWVTQVVGELIVDNCTAEGVKEGIVLTSTANATITNTTIDASNVAIRAGQTGAADGTINEFTFNYNTLKSGAIAIQLRGNATDANLSMTENVVSGTPHISGNTADTNISADANYWGEGLTGPVVDGTNVDVNSYYADEAREQLIVTALTLQQFVEKVTEGNGTYNGTFTEGGVEKKITVKVVPVSGDARTTDDVRVPNRLQKYTNPEVYYAQYQRFSELTDVNISNVNFVFYPAAVTVTDAWNTAGATTTADNINGELQLLNTGSVSFANCSFEKMSVSPINAATLSVTSSTFNGLDAYAIKDIKATTATITGTTFTDCNGGFWFNNAPTTLTVTDNTFTGTGRRGAIQFSANGDYANTVMTVTGNEVTDEAAFLWQLNNTISNAQLNAILDKNNNTYETAFVAGSVELHLQGEGTEENPYLINDISDLEFFRDDVNAGNKNKYQGKYVKLTADIDLNNEEWTPIGNNTNKFQGYFDGNEKTISNLKISGNNDYVGLFGYILGQGMSASITPSVKDLTLENVDVSGDYYVGGLSGQAYTCNITNVTVKGEVSGARYVGGLVGHVYTYFKECHFIGNASCSFDALGGIAGAGDCRAYDCSVIGDITGSNWVGGIVGNGQEGTSAVGCYVKGDVKTSTNWYFGVGGIAGVAGHGYSSSEFKNNYFDGEVYLEGEKVPAMIIGIVNAENNETIYATIEGNSWNTAYYDVNIPVYVTAEAPQNGTTENWIAGASEELTKPRNNNLIMLESDLPYVTEEDYVIMSFSEVTEEQVEQALINNAVAKIGETTYTTLQKALDAAVAGTGNVTVEIIKDINLTNVDWNPVTVSAPGYPLVTVEGNGKTITGLNDMLFAGTWAGNSGLIINDLTIANSNIVHDENDSAGNIGVGAFIGFPQASATITLNKCHLVNSTVNGGHWTGGLIGMAGGYNGNDGPVFMNLTIKDCSVTGSIITGKGSCGGIIGHGSCAAWTAVNIQNTTVSGNTVTSTGSSTNKAGAIMGTIGAAGQPTTANGVTLTGGAMVSATVADNTVTSGETAITTIYGRQGTETGMLELNGGSYDKYPIEEGVAYAAPAEGYKIEQNGNGTYGVVVDPAYGKVAMIGDVYYETLAEAHIAATNGQTITLLNNITLSEKFVIEKSITLDGNDKTLTYTGTDRAIDVPNNENANIDVTVKNLTVVATTANRGLNYNENGEFNVEGVTVTIGENVDGYAINFPGMADNAQVTIKDSKLTSRNPLNIWGENMTINVYDSEITSVDNSDTYNYAAIQLNNEIPTVGPNGAIANGTVVTVTGGKITALDETGEPSLAVANATETGVVNISETTVVVGKQVNYVLNIAGVYFASLQEAIDAIEKYGYDSPIVVMKSFATSETATVKNGLNVTINLNGKTITGTDNATGSFGLIEIQPGAELIINDSSDDKSGKITLTATNNREWNAYSSVISNQRGMLTVNGGTIEHLGGTDMAYGIDNLTNGKGTYAATVINGGTIKSTYRGIRQFLNGTEAQNILTVNGGTIEGANKSIWMQDPNANANTGTLTVGANAQLKGDVYLYVTDGSTSWPVEVSIAADALKDGAQVLTANVPAGYELKLEDGVYGVKHGVAKIGDVLYESLAEAATAATTGQTIELLWQEGQAPIAMNASLYGNKNVTITGNATVDWSKGFLFVGRGGEGDATLTFYNANLTSASDNASTGIHVSGRQKNTNDKYDGTVNINNSTIELDYLINKGTMTLDNSTLTVKNGFSVGGRPASETESGEDATATMELKNGSKVVVNRHNGMGLGYEAIGVMNVNSGSTFETTQNFLITAKGTMNVDETSKIVNTNNSWINNKGVIKFNGSTLKDNYIDSEGATEFAGTINFEGNNSVITAEIKGSPFELIVKEDATLLISRFVLGYDRAITVYGNIEDAHNLTAEQIASMTPSLKFNSTSGVSVGGTNTGRLTAKDAYLEFGNSSWKNSYAEHIWSFENCYVSATSFGNNNAQGNTTSTWDVTFDNSVLAAKNYIKNGVGVSYNFTNGSVATTGSMRIDGELNVDATSSVTTTAQQNNVAGAVDEHGGVNGTINIAGTLTIGSNATTQLEVLGGEVNVTETGNIILLENTLTLDATSKMRSCGNITGAITAEESTDIEITGGTYTQDVNEWCHADYDAIDNGNNTWTVIQVAGTQTREFAYPGWYWFSTYIDFESGEEGLDELQEQLGDNAATIKGQTAFTNYQYYNGVPFWTSALTSISASEMYMIKTTNKFDEDEQTYENVRVSLEGDFVDYENYGITIHNGWNWIGYPLNTEVSVTEALAGFNPAEGDMIKGKTQGSSSSYNPTLFGGWYPDFNMIPGEGYMYYSAASGNKTLTYRAGNSGTQNAKTSVEDNHWIVDEYKYSNNMTVIAMLSIDGEIVKGNYEVAAFANGECRGSARPIYIESIDAYVLFMTIHGDEVEELTFMYYDIDKDTEYELNNVMNYSNDAIVGTIDNPYIFSMNILGIGENSIDNINIYPNPTTTDREINLQAICDKVEVFNALGVKVAEYHNVDTLDALETAGIYVIRITNDNAVKHCRLVVK